ncbi:MAG: hypothetical protein ACE5JD_16130 [Candidatus Methylomirabilia bacterium]
MVTASGRLRGVISGGIEIAATLVSVAVIVNLIGSTRTSAGLRVRCELDRGTYPKGQEVSDAQMAMLKLVPHRVHGD